ncbi:aspartate/glutamate racemase family protein [Microbacterium excoecariae]|uniref:aspartate/glutamate racemase family protein n=1 Tax=Microbacterium excoecariae TaxID=2715210 RepID=UPI00140BC2BE|nr:aspartate/glutamate racemase family protein [Microbacterium excoecariae]NHI17541.1 aspartate/glutamate racemase family protein [Microbacterium excoecariae]
MTISITPALSSKRPMQFARPAPTLGILGGMGPLAGAEFFHRLSAAFPASSDQQHPVVHLLSNPRIMSRSSAVLSEDQGHHEAVEGEIRAGVEALISLGADVIAVPCNTAHHFIDRFHDDVFAAHPGHVARRHTNDRPPAVLAHIVDATIDRLARSGHAAGWLLATRGTVCSQIYTARATARAIDLRLPDERVQDAVDRCIAAVKAGRTDEAASLAADVAESLTGLADFPLIAACTELPIAFAAGGTPIPHISSIDALVDHTISLLQRGREGIDERAPVAQRDAAKDLLREAD